MNKNYIFQNINTALPTLMSDLLEAPAMTSRAGGVHELTHVGITLRKPQDRYIVLSDRKASLPAQIAETVWVMSGRRDIEWLKHYLPRATDFSDDGETWRAGYGPRIRAWQDQAQRVKQVDQLAYVVDTLRKDPASRQAVISLWDPQVDTTPGKDIACNNWLSFSSRLGRLDLHVGVRSNDAMWGWSGINAFEWSTLQEIVAGLLGIEVGSLHFSVTSFHLYERHWVKAHRIAENPRVGSLQLKRSPGFQTEFRDLGYFDELLQHWFRLEYDIRTGSTLVDGYVERFPEPMLRSWLRVLQWWWSEGDRSYLEPYKGTLLYEAVLASIQPEREKRALDAMTEARKQVQRDEHERAVGSPFLQYVTKLHDEKHAAYGDSWKRRGEMLGIMANIARKIDRLGGSATADETSADTAIDLAVYLAKYRVWLDDTHTGGFQQSNTPGAANELLGKVEERASKGLIFTADGLAEEYLTKTFDRLEDAVKREDKLRHEIVDDMLIEAYALARRRWETEQDQYRGADVD